MAKKSVIMGLPIVPFNQNRLSDVCQYLDYLENFFLEVFTPVNEPPVASGTSPADIARRRDRILSEVKVPLCGDLLGRERITGAKRTRLGCDYKTEKFQNIIENVAQWHSKQAFLVYIWEQLYNASPICGREVGTLFNLRQQFKMVNVYNDVKKNYKSAEHLMLSTTKAYLCCAFMHWAGMETISGNPVNVTLPPHSSSHDEKKKFLECSIGKFVEEYVLVECDVEKAWKEQKEHTDIHQTCPPQSSEKDPPLIGNSVQDDDLKKIGQIVLMVYPQVPGTGYKVLGVGHIAAVQGNVPLDVIPVSVVAVEQIAGSIMKVGQVVLWPKIHIAIPGPNPSNPPATQQQSSPPNSSSNVSNEGTDVSDRSDSQDKLMNYASQCLQLGLMLMQMNDTEKEGDGTRCIMNWKLLMLYFRSRKRGTKYAFEAMRLITCVKALFTEKTAHRIIHGQFVNNRGGPGNNCANDLRMEMLVKDYKGILKRMCGNKTLKAVHRSTSAAYGLHNIADVIDKESGVSPDSTKHAHISTQEMVEEMITILQEKKPFHYKAGRTLQSFPNISKSPLDQLDATALHKWLARHKKRLAANAFETCDDGDDNNDEDADNDSEVEESDVHDNSDDNETDDFVIA